MTEVEGVKAACSIGDQLLLDPIQTDKHWGDAILPLSSQFFSKEESTSTTLQASKQVANNTNSSESQPFRNFGMSRKLRYFISYAHKDKQQAYQLVDLMKPRLTMARDFKFEDWIDAQISVGTRWEDEIKDELANSDFGLLLLSPEFLASSFIRDQELPTYIDQIEKSGGETLTKIKKTVVPVLLKALPLGKKADLAGLEQLQIFKGNDGISFSDIDEDNKREHFANELVEGIIRKLEVLYKNNE